MDTLKSEYEPPQTEGGQRAYSTMYSSSSSSSLSSGSISPKDNKTGFRNWMVEADSETAEEKSFNSDLESSLPSPSNLPFFPRKRRESRKERRARTTFTSQQTQVLEVEYRRSEYISRPRRYELATQLNLKEVQIKIWYQNRRAKDKRIEKASWDRQYRCLGLMAVAAAGQFPATSAAPSSSVNYRQLLSNNAPPHPLLFPTSPTTTLSFPFPFLAQMQMAATPMPTPYFGDKEKLKAT